MGHDVAAEYPAAGEAFAVASGAIGLDLYRVCFEGPEEDLARTDICQPAILTTSVALLRAIEQAAGHPPQADAAAGLSLGEYTALVAAGALEFADAVRLVHHRGTYMQEACEARAGTMFSIIGMQDVHVEEACQLVREEEGGEVWPANYNSPGQVVISGETAAAESAADHCTRMGARRVIRLKVAGAFHSPLMQPAAQRLAKELQRTAFRAPAMPVVANTTGEPVTSPDEIRHQLTLQLTSATRWAQSMKWCIAHGYEEFMEIGPGRVLRGLLKKIDPGRVCAAIGTLDEVQGLTQSRETG